MDNRITFSGAFLVKNPPSAAKKELSMLVGKHKQIFEDFNNKSDVLYIVRRGKDKGIADFIYENNLRFKYFPYLNTKSGLDPLYPQKALNMLQAEQNVITDKSVLGKIFKLLPLQPKIDMNAEGVAYALKLKPEELSIRTVDNMTLAFTKDNVQMFKSSPVNKYGENYVYSFVNGRIPEKYLVHGDKIMFKYPRRAYFFDKNFNDTVLLAPFERF